MNFSKTIKKILAGSGTLALALTVAVADAGAQDAPDAENLDMNGMTVVGVTPLNGAGRNAREAQSLSFSMARENKDLKLDETHLGKMGDEGEGLGFAGTSDRKDILALRVGDALAVGILQPWKGTVRKQLQAAIPALGLEDETEKMLMSAVESQIASVTLFYNIVNSLEESSDESQRTIGYVASGAWARLAKMSADNGYAFPGSHIYGHSLAEMLDKDAIYGGSDRQLAEALRKIAKGLEEAVDEALVAEGYQQTLLLRADEETGAGADEASEDDTSENQD
ncbi:MAG: hypothetical protein ACQEVA_06655 [Myxococcota bacterium]